MRRLFCFLTAMLQLLMGAALAVLEVLSGKRGGINHHVLARKHQWSQGLLSPERLQQADLVLGLLALALAAALWRGWRESRIQGREGKRLTVPLLTTLVLALLTLGSHHMPLFTQLRTASYLTLALAGATLLQLLLLGVLWLADPPTEC